MPLNEPKLKDVLSRLGVWAEGLVAGLTPAEQEQAWLASMALLRRSSVDPFGATPLPVERTYEEAVDRLRAARAGDREAEQGFDQLVREGYLAAREESLGSFTADLDQETRLAVTALACFSHNAHGQPPQEAVMQALRVAYDRSHDPDQDLVQRSSRMLAAALEEVEGSTVVRHAVTSFVTGNMRSLDGLLG